MRLRDRNHDEQARAADTGGGGGNLDELRQAGQAFLSAGDNAIDRVLSSDSESFNEATRQEGGQ